MRTASPITIIREAVGGAERVAFIEVGVVAALLDNFLTALEAPPAEQPIYMEFARRMAEVRLADWGVAR